jgi:hypothetical protein
MRVSDFLSSITNSKGFARPNLYSLEMTPPDGITIDSYNLEGICLNCKSASFPGKTLESQAYNSDGYIGRQMPLGFTYSPINLTFHLSADHREKKFFDEWLNMAYNDTTNTLNYYDDFVGSMIISQLNRNNTVLKSYLLYESFPISVNEINVGSDMENNITDLSVSIAYRKYKDLT